MPVSTSVDYALGAQPTGSDSSPGSFQLRITNATGADLQALELVYEVHVRNNEERSSRVSIRVIRESDGAEITAPSLDLDTPEAAGAAPVWVPSMRSGVLDLSAIPIADGANLIVSFDIDDLAGSGSGDEIAIDDVLVAVPTCGDGTMDAGEVCDDGNVVTETECPYGTMSCAACNEDCTSMLSLTGRYCGDGTTDSGDGEECYDGDTMGGDGCSESCTIEMDVGVADAGMADGGTVGVDDGAADAGAASDAGPAGDGGTADEDAGAADEDAGAGDEDAGAVGDDGGAMMAERPVASAPTGARWKRKTGAAAAPRPVGGGAALRSPSSSVRSGWRWPGARDDGGSAARATRGVLVGGGRRAGLGDARVTRGGLPRSGRPGCYPRPSMAADREPLEVLLELTRQLADERSLEEALQATTDAALELLPCNHASLRLFDEHRRELLSTARSGAGAGKAPAPFRAGEGVLGIVADTGRAALVTDTVTDERFKKASTGFPVRSLVAVPMNAGGRVVGVLSASSSEPGHFAERDRDLAQLLANCTAPAIETARLGRLAVTDDLTRAFNHRYLSSRLPEEVGRARRYGDAFSVLMMDLDHFKQVNDTHGHAIGDEVLRGFVDRVRAEVREPDVLIRRGGEEFLLLMPSTPAEEALAVAERIRARVASAPIPTESDDDVPLTVSIGVSTWRPDESGREVEARADAALYRAKDAGRDRVMAEAI